jgi:hypothetical protein
MAYYNLDLDQFLPLASETIGYDFSSLVSPDDLQLICRHMLITNYFLSLPQNST